MEAEVRYVDYDVLENMHCISEKEIIIYGAGNYGKQAARMLEQLGFLNYCFCDSEASNQGRYLMGRPIVAPVQIKSKDNLLVIVAMENKEIKKEIEESLAFTKGIVFLSYFVLDFLWRIWAKNYTTIESKLETLSAWYEILNQRGYGIKRACMYSTLVYQSGKVGSLTISESLWAVGEENAHIHRFFFEKDIVGKLLLDDIQKEFIRNSNFFYKTSSGYVKDIKDKMRNKKIITLVREPIAVDLSTVFQLIGDGVSDKYFSRQLKGGMQFAQAVAELMVRIKNRMFDWFDEELKELCDIDIFDYPFNREDGYTIILDKDVKILVVKLEKLSELTDVIKEFIGNSQFELRNANRGKDKEYAHIYSGLKENLKLSREYIEYYYEKNKYMDYFYTKEEQSHFLSEWRKYKTDE